jgi:hypothetical protein
VAVAVIAVIEVAMQQVLLEQMNPTHHIRKTKTNKSKQKQNK